MWNQGQCPEHFFTCHPYCRGRLAERNCHRRKHKRRVLGCVTLRTVGAYNYLYIMRQLATTKDVTVTFRVTQNVTIMYAYERESS